VTLFVSLLPEAAEKRVAKPAPRGKGLLGENSLQILLQFRRKKFAYFVSNIADAARQLRDFFASLGCALFQGFRDPFQAACRYVSVKRGSPYVSDILRVNRQFA
jgi:hypothetical protein